MTSFHIRVKDSIQSIGSWEETIQRINELNDLLLKALKKRSKYPVCRDYFENTPKKELREKGIDDILWDSFYSKIVEKICPEGDYVEGVVKKEAELEELLHERVQIGEKVIAYKAPRGKQITRKPREDEIYAYVKDYASKNGMNPDDVVDVFKIVIEKNKYIQRLLNSHQGNHLKEVSKCKTMISREEHKRIEENGSCLEKAPDHIKSIAKRLRVQGDLLAEKTGKTYHIVFGVESDKDTHILPVYAVKLVEE